MGWFKRKTKEEKVIDLQKEVDKLNEKYKDIINYYCKIGSYIFILKGFKVEKNEIVIQFKDKDTIEGYINYIPLSFFSLKYDTTDFKIARFQFIQFKENLKKIGLKLELIN
jgi:hypothetical protein